MTSVLVYGGGVPALATAMALLDAGVAVDLAGPTDAARHPHFPEGGIACGRDADAFARGLAGGGEPRPALRTLAQAAGTVVERLAAWGMPFAMDGDDLAFRRLPGWPEADAAYVGASTAQVAAWTLDVEVSRRARGGALRRLPERELLELVRDDAGDVVGAILLNRVTGSIEGVGATAVVLATAGPAGSTAGAAAHGFPEAAVAAAYRAGAHLRGDGRPRLHPTLLAHGHHPQPLSSALRAEGARFWVPDDDKEARIPRDIPSGDRDYFVEEALGEDGRLADARTLAELVRRVTRERGVYDRVERAAKGTAYLDISHLPAGHVASRVGEELRAIAGRAPRDPTAGPFEVSSGAVSLGAALAVDEEGEREGRTNLNGLWAVGEAAWRDLADKDGVALLAAIHHGQRAAEAIALALEDEDNDEAVETARAAFEDRLDDAPDVTEELAELAERIDAIAFGDDPKSLRPWLEERIEETDLDGATTDHRHRGLRAGLELALATCEMGRDEGVTDVRRSDDGEPEVP